MMSTQSYAAKVEAKLRSAEDYEVVSATTASLNEETAATIRTTDNKLPERLEAAIVPTDTRMSQFYGIPKSHKPGLPLRPVVNTCNSPTG